MKGFRKIKISTVGILSKLNSSGKKKFWQIAILDSATKSASRTATYAELIGEADLRSFFHIDHVWPDSEIVTLCASWMYDMYLGEVAKVILLELVY